MLPPNEEIKSRLLQQRFIFGGHWLWVGCCFSNGYGSIGINYKTYRVHKVAYAIFNNINIEDIKLNILHKTTCPYKNCFNPSCLYEGNQSQNAHDKVTLGRHRTMIKRRLGGKCKRGHILTKENITYSYSPSGYRIILCRKCNLESVKRYQVRVKLLQN